ncbi:vWA domain-containing protein [Pedobacter psychroterrae]|uniref:VWA domain-containing protein n=1 Tax=Pedobacter psychroterrae TaxID=2530453 RepID=A0A4R0NUN9_9SPHI|nr:VWA domain-containing protein [Pedobacter psychroterrae]TCD03723.1 VWA domain-containing protein [Pedobacter psychroterrae]
MSDPFNIYILTALLGCLLAGVLFAWLLYRNTVHLDKRLRYSLFASRAVVVALIAFLLSSPLIRSISYQLEKPVIVIGQDNSLSAGNIFPAGFNMEQYENDLKSLADKLSEKYEVKLYSFSDSVKSGLDFSHKGKLSNAAQFINQLNDELLNRNVGAVILATDGIFNRGGSPLYDMDKLNAPVYTIALGDTVPKKDVLVVNVNYNSLVYLDNEFTIDIQAQAFESKGTHTLLSVLENGKKVYEERIQITANPFLKSITVKLKALKLGLQKYTIQLSPVQGEISELNNIQQIYVEVIDTRQKVLIAAAGPHPDIAALKQVISLNKHYDLKIVIGEELDTLNPNDYGLIILYQLPGLQFNTQTFMGKLKQSTASLWYILGAQSDLPAFSSSQTGVTFIGSNGTLQDAFSYPDPNFTAFNLDLAAAKKIDGYDPLQAPFGRVMVNADASVALSQRIGKIKTGNPQLFFISDNGRKTAYLIGEGLWRWKLAEAKEENPSDAVERLISGTVQYLSVKDDKRKFKAYTTKSTFEENENILVNAVLYNDSYVPINTPDVNMEIRNEAGKIYKFLFSRTGATYQLDAGIFPAGTYNYTARTILGDKEHLAKGLFYVNALVAEYQQTIANHQLLNTMSAQTNGKMYMPRDLNKILSAVISSDEIKTVSYEQRKYEELINFKWLFALIIILLSLEWFFRKRNGEI